jgi:Na+/H+-dicarboxylate symporter
MYFILFDIYCNRLYKGVTAAKLEHNKKLILTVILLFIASSTFSSIFGTVLIFITKPGVMKMTDNSSYRKNFSNINTENSLNVLSFSQEDTIYDLFM